MSKKPCFRTPFNSQHTKGSQTLPKSAQQHFYQILSSLRPIYSWKMSFLAIFEILGLFLNILNDHHKYSLCNREHLQQSIQMQLSKKEKLLSEFFTSSLKSASDFEYFLKKKKK